MNTEIKLFCFPYGGAGVSIYNGWNELFEDDIEIIPMQLPGRERLIDEEPYKDIHIAADAFAELIKKQYNRCNIAFFGHCFLGSILSYEVIRRLEGYKEINILCLYVSSAFTPKSNRKYNLNFNNDEQFLVGVENLTGFTNPAFAIPELKELLLPSLKADFEMDMNYKMEDNYIINIPITAIYAENDTFVSKKEVELWSKYTVRDFNLFKVAGEHLYISKDPQETIDIIRESLNLLKNINSVG